MDQIKVMMFHLNHWQCVVTLVMNRSRLRKATGQEELLLGVGGCFTGSSAYSGTVDLINIELENEYSQVNSQFLCAVLLS